MDLIPVGRWMVRLARAALAVPLLWLAGCGGGGGGGGTDPAAPAAAVARVEILSGSAWLPGIGQTRQLEARAYDADGRPVPASFTWASSRDAAVTVDADGRLTSRTDAGSAQISARAGGVASRPLLAFVATPAPGVVLVDEAQIVGPLVETAPGAVPSLANTYQVTLTGMPAPAVDSLLLGRGDTPLAGRVVQASASGAQTVVTLQLVPLDELFGAVNIDEVFDLAQAEVEIPPDVAARYTVSRSGNTWSFVPKPGATMPSAARPDTRTRSSLPRRQAVTGTYARDLLPFRQCEVAFADFNELDDLPIGLEAPTFSLTLNPSYEARLDSQNHIRRLVVSADPAVSIGFALKASAPLAGSVKCTLELLALRLPIGGPLSLFIGGVVPVGVGFDLEATVTLAETRLGATYDGGVRASVGMECLAPAGCAFVRSLSAPYATVKPFFDPPNLATDLRLKPEVDLYGYLDVEFGNPLVGSLRFETFKARIGGKLAGEFAPPVTQVLDDQFSAAYKASVKGSAKLGSEISDLVTLLGLGSLSDLGLEFEQSIANSPKAISVHADRATFAAGDPVRISVRLDPASVNFLPGLYNVDSVQLRRRIGGVTEVLASQTASPGQDRFEFDVSAPAAGNVEEWTAFVTTRLLPIELASLELGSPSPVGVAVQMTQAEISAAAGCQALLHNGSIDARAEPEGSYEDGDGFVVASGRCQATLGAGSAGATVRTNVSGPELAQGADPVDIAVLSASGSIDASALASVPVDAVTDAGTFRWVGYLDEVFAGNHGRWELIVQGQAVTLTVTGSLDAAVFSVQWFPSPDGVGETGVYSPNPPPGQLATGPINHTVRLQPGQRLVVEARTGWDNGTRSPFVDGDPATSDTPTSASASGSGAWAFTLRFDP